MRNRYDVNSLAVPRRAKEAIGALSLLKNAETGHQVGRQRLAPTHLLHNSRHHVTWKGARPPGGSPLSF